ncbi:MAG TPA: hypothetical protein VL172_03400 [Kofleriaceae bacterium]|jgi:hypothetical protein|nr:hypothetical protein [Kofleriaceae bacterium]
MNYGQPQYAQRPPKRSAIPKVMGILMIIFGGLGLLGGLAAVSGASQGMNKEMMDKNPAFHDKEFGGDKLAKVIEDVQHFQRYAAIPGLLAAAFQLWVGILAVKYKKAAPKMAMIFGVVNIVQVIGQLVLYFVWISPALSDAPPFVRSMMGMGFFVGAIFGMAWPVLILALMSRPPAKAACVN